MRLLNLFFTISICAIVLLSGFQFAWTIQSTFILNHENKEMRNFVSKQAEAPFSFYQETLTSYKTRRDKEEEYRIKLELLSPSDLSFLEQKYHRNISIHWLRELLPETPRLWDRKCFQDETFQETLSVVIPYYNEDLMLLLRTITTLVYRTPPNNLLEILLIDDCSDDDISDEIRAYAEGMRIPVKLSRNAQKLGIANARLLGINNALGSVIMILDSHMEVGEVWLEPLLRVLTDKPRALAVPRLRMRNEADKNAFDREHGPLWTVDLTNGYGLIQFGRSIDAKAVKGEEHLPVMSVGLFGGAFAGYRSYLLEIYPLAVLAKKWGIENSRISIRSWLCGEGIFVSPCSFVSHTNGPDVMLSRYSKEQPSMMEDLKKESMAEVINFIKDETDKLKMISRVANTDEAKQIIIKTSKEIQNYFNPDDHQCVKDFKWHSDNILSQMYGYTPMDSSDSLYVGQVKSLTFPDMCLEHAGSKLNVYFCRKQPLVLEDSHVIQFTKNYAIRVLGPNLCFDLGYPSKDKESVTTMFYGCHANNGNDGVTGVTQTISYIPNNKWIYHNNSERCLDATGLVNMQEVHWTPCNMDNKGQLWDIEPVTWF